MQMPPVGTSVEKHLDEFGEHHLAALGADEGAAALAGAFEKTQQDLRDAYAARQAAERLVTRAEALALQAELELEETIRGVESPLLLSTKKRRDVDPYRAVFPKGLAGALGPRGAAQLVEGERILAALRSTPGVDPALAALGTSLEAALATARARITSLSDAETALVSASTAEQVQKRRWRDEYRRSYGGVLALYPNDRRKVESFFKRVSRRQRGEVDAPAPATVRDDAG